MYHEDGFTSMLRLRELCGALPVHAVFGAQNNIMCVASLLPSSVSPLSPPATRLLLPASRAARCSLVTDATRQPARDAGRARVGGGGAAGEHMARGADGGHVARRAPDG